MSQAESKPYCCCHMFPIVCGAYLIAAHSFLQGMYGVCLLLTSHYRPPHRTVNGVALASYLCLFPTALVVFLATMYESSRGACVSAFVVAIVSLFNVVAGLLYYISYSNFRANSQVDKSLFWASNGDWVSDRDFPFTMWHVLTYVLVVTTPIWWHHAYVMFRLSKILAKKQRVEEVGDPLTPRPWSEADGRSKGR